MNTMRDSMIAENAVISSIFIQDGTGYVTITYTQLNPDQVIDENFLILLVGKNTVIRDQFGKRSSLENLKEDMIIDAVFSSAMTRSNPPQSRAYLIQTVQENDSSLIEESRVLNVEKFNGFYYILTGYEDDIYSQVRYVVSDETKIRDRCGKRISAKAIKPGQIVRIERANFQTASIPPQTSALTVQILY